MAEAFPSFVLDTVVKQLESPIFQDNKLNYCLRIQFRELRSKLELFGDVIVDAELMAALFPEKVRWWVCELQRLLHEVDDLLDEALTRSLSLDSDGMVEKVNLRIYNLPFVLTLSHKMRTINKRLESIVKECCECNLLVVEPGHEPPQPCSSSNLVVGSNEKLVARNGIMRYDPDYVKDDDFHMIGRDDQKEKVIKMLLNDDLDHVSVFGNVGMGKTTLCRAVYNDEEVRNHFEVRIWVASRSFDYFSCVEFWKKIIRILGADEATIHGETEEKAQLKDKVVSLFGKNKTLLVLDDFSRCFIYFRKEWLEFWFEIRNLISKSQKGSKVLVTSLRDVCDYGTLSGGASLGLSEDDLSEEHSWSIFQKAALVPVHDRPGWMIDLGGEIVSRCLGNPALLKGVGTLLYGKDDRATWQCYAHDFDFKSHYDHYIKFSENVYVFQNSLRKFGYLQLFSLSRFRNDTIYQQLDAHGFAHFSEEPTMLDLKYFILSKADEENSDNWDLHHEDFEILKQSTDCVSKTAGTEFRVLDWRDTFLPEAVRHVSIIRPPSSTGQQQQNIILSNSLINDVIHRRSLIFLGNMLPVRMSGQMLDKLASNLRYLRVLDLQDMALQVLPSSVGMLVHLRYLDLSRNNFRRLPRSICKLKNLLTLKLVYCDKLVRLPQRIRNLHCLKNLEINMCWDLTHLPSTIARLTCLEGLDRLIVSPHTGGLRYLEQLNNLKGCLSIELPQQWKESVVDAEGAYLDRKKGLTALDFKWQSARNGDGKNDSDDVLEKLKPCSGIENLFIVNYGGKKFPSWITSLDSLTVVTISKCKSCKILPSFHKMPHLRSLTLTSLNIEYIEDNHSDHVFYPSLKELKIGRMDRLKGWSRGLCKVANGLPRFGHISTVEIWKCPCLTVMPSFSNIGNLILQDVCEKTLQLNDWGSCYSIEIISIQGMVLLPNQFAAKAPQVLTIRDCNRLRTLWASEVEGTEAWKSYVGNLSIINCPAIKHLSDNLKHLTVLHNLTLSKCNEELDCLYYEDEDGMPWKALRKLTCLTIEGFENLVALPRSLQHLPYLRELEIRDCKALKWEVDRAPKMRSPSDLIFKSCPHITPVTEELKREYRAKGVRVTG